MKHTPGPWTIATGDALESNSLIRDANGFGVVELFTQQDKAEQAANAALVSCAPELLVYCKEFLIELKQRDEMPNVQNHLRGLIARAEGKA